MSRKKQVNQKITALYCRISLEDGGDNESMSISNQKLMLRDFAEKNGMFQYEYYVDDGYTGRNFNRPSFQRMIADIEAGKIGCVITKDLSRLGRNYIEAGSYIEIFFPKHNVRYIAITDGVDSLTRQEMDITPFKNILNDMYSRDISKKVLAGRMTRSRQGKFCGGQPPLGLMRDPEDKGHLILDPETAPVIRKIYDMALDGWGCMRIAKQLMDDKVPITRVKSNTECDVNYYSWGSARISHILRNPFYKGAHLVCRTHQKGIRSNTYDIIPREDWEIIEEVQFMPRFEEVLNSLLRISNIDVYVTGSNSKFLSSDIVTEFRGRGDEIRIYPLSFAEFYAAYDGDYDDAWEEYMIYGGLPQVAQFSVERQKAEYLKNIFTNVYIKDVVERNRIQNVDEIGTLVDILASAIGAPTNPTKISNTFKSERGINYSNKTISNHIDYLAEAFLISKADRYDIKGRKYVGANLKYYFSDIGLRNARLNFRQQEPTHIMENIVYNELLVRGYNVDVGIVDVFAKNSDGKRVHKQLEVDFVVNQGSQRYYIQVAYDMTSEEKQTQELNSLRNIPDSFKKIVIVNGTKKPWRNEEGFVIMGMKYFLLNEDSLEF